MHRSFRLVCFIAALVGFVLLATPASAQYFGRNKVQYDKFDFKVFRTEHFEFYYYPEEEQAVRDAARMAERWYRRHSQTYLRDFKERKPIIFYANDADFQQTNVISGAIGQGTGGVTEGLKERVTMPLTGLYSETNHVLGHELVHSFQYDIGLSRTDSIGFALNQLPLWLIEGTAEYLSVGREDPHTAMWLRDAALREDVPTIEQLTRSSEYFPYRYGQAYMAYVGGKYGDAAVANLFKLGGRVGLDSAFVYTLGISADSLSNEWIRSVNDTYLPLMEGRTAPDSAGRRVLASDIDAGDINISPAVSPDGKWVAFLSERNVFTIDLFIADAETGEVVDNLRSSSANPHFDAIRFLNSAGTWSPDGKKFAFITFVKGDNEIAVWDLNAGEIERRIKVEGVTAITHPAWSPNGETIAFSGMDGGISDLYVLDLETNAVRQLTNDRYADLQPAWSPDGQTLAFVTDRGPEGADFDALSFADERIGLIDVNSGDIEVVRPFRRGKHVNPQFSPDGRSLYFVSDHDGFKDIYRYELATQALFRVTELKTGVSGITALSPAMSVAAQSGRMMFSVFHDNEYTVFSLEPEETEGEPVAPSLSENVDPSGEQTDDVQHSTELAIAGVLPPYSALNEGLVSNYLKDPMTGLPDAPDSETKGYNPKLQLDYVAPPTVGVSVGGAYGSGVAGGVGFFFSDMLGNHNLGIAVQANGTFKDIGAQASYLNQGSRFNYGASAGHIPVLYRYQQYGFSGGLPILEEIQQRIFIDQASLVGSYPLSTTKRFELSAGFVRYGFDIDIFRFGAFGGRERVNPEDVGIQEPDPLYFFQGGAAYVGDFSFFGFTSPTQGGRYRFQVAPRVGTATFVTALADYRRYFFANPVTFAIRGLHIGNYGAASSSGSNIQSAFTQEYLGSTYYPGFVRGYGFNSTEDFECNSADELTDEGRCAVTDRLQGTRIAVASMELRLPLLGTDSFGLVNFPYLPTEVSVFTDAGLAWNEGDNPFDLLKFETDTNERVPVISTGVSTRFNILGYLVFEMFYAYPFQRPEKGAHFGFQLAPGW